MGQARKRGSREDRIQQSLARRMAEDQTARITRAFRAQEYRHWYWSLDDSAREEENARHRRKNDRSMSLAMVLGIVAAAAGGGWRGGRW